MTWKDLTISCPNGNLIDITSDEHIYMYKGYLPTSCEQEIMYWRPEVRNCNGQSTCTITSSPTGECSKWWGTNRRNYEEICYNCKMFDRKCANENLTLTCPYQYLIKVIEVEVGTTGSNGDCHNSKPLCKDGSNDPGSLDYGYANTSPKDINGRFTDVQNVCNNKQICTLEVYLFPGAICKEIAPYNYEKVTYECEYNPYTTETLPTTNNPDLTTESPTEVITKLGVTTTAGITTKYATIQDITTKPLKTQKITTQPWVTTKLTTQTVSTRSETIAQDVTTWQPTTQYDATTQMSTKDVTNHENMTQVTQEISPEVVTAHELTTQDSPISAEASIFATTIASSANGTSVNFNMAQKTSVATIVVPTVIGIAALTLMLIVLMLLMRKRRRDTKYNKRDNGETNSTYNNVAFNNEGDGKIDIGIEEHNTEVNGTEHDTDTNVGQLIDNDIYDTGTSKSVKKSDPRFIIKREDKNGDPYTIIEKPSKRSKKLVIEKPENGTHTIVQAGNKPGVANDTLPTEAYELTTYNTRSPGRNFRTVHTNDSLNEYEYDTPIDVDSKYIVEDNKGVIENFKSNDSNTHIGLCHKPRILEEKIEHKGLDQLGLTNTNVDYDQAVSAQPEYVYQEVKEQAHDLPNVDYDSAVAEQSGNVSKAMAICLNDNSSDDDKIKINAYTEPVYNSLSIGNKNKIKHAISPREKHPTDNYSVLSNTNNFKEQQNMPRSHDKEQCQQLNDSYMATNAIEMLDNELYTGGKF
ncbi:unnamed protein product [Owenia fusiformis]|uniref:SUEL-type lectin domain-containing protein n=1 Tax=Owenia fusiformis TaxID=6347 RepID=A0A8S4NDE4_OWEFU|nr:unnamed protein product [Owenia fusiformis]